MTSVMKQDIISYMCRTPGIKACLLCRQFWIHSSIIRGTRGLSSNDHRSLTFLWKGARKALDSDLRVSEENKSRWIWETSKRTFSHMFLIYLLWSVASWFSLVKLLWWIYIKFPFILKNRFSYYGKDRLGIRDKLVYCTFSSPKVLEHLWCT